MNLGINPLNASFTKWSNTLKQFAAKLLTNCFSVFDHFVVVVLKGLINKNKIERLVSTEVRFISYQ